MKNWLQIVDLDNKQSEMEKFETLTKLKGFPTLLLWMHFPVSPTPASGMLTASRVSRDFQRHCRLLRGSTGSLRGHYVVTSLFSQGYFIGRYFIGRLFVACFMGHRGIGCF